MLWKEKVQLEFFNYSLRYISGWNVDPEFFERWLITSFYGQPEVSKRHKFQTLLFSLNPQDSPWFICGDFNEMLHHHKKKGGRDRPESQMRKFRSAIINNCLFDLKYIRDNFTLSNKHSDGSITKERLDRVAANSAWKNLFSEISVESLLAIFSDHKPVLLFASIS